MIWKLFRYDFRGVGKKLFPLYALALLFALMSRLFVVSPGLGNAFVQPDWVRMILGMIFALTWMLVGSIFVVTSVTLLTKYFRSTYGEEGYLTHTLPITTTQKILSKMLSFYVWYLIATLVALSCIFVMFFDSSVYFDFVRAMIDAFRDILPTLSFDRLLAGFLYFIIMIIAPVQGILMMYLCAGIGAMFKHKFVSGVCAYFVISFISTLFSNIFFADLFNFDRSHISILRLPSVILVTMILCTAAFFFGTKYLLDKQLNLE